MEANCCFLRQAAAECDELFAAVDKATNRQEVGTDNEQEDGPSGTPCTDVVYISNDE